MKKIGYTLIAAVIGLSATQLYSQNPNESQKPTLITRSENMIEVPSIASQIAAGTFKPAVNVVKEFNPKHWGHNTSIPGKGLPNGDDPLWQKQAQVNKTPGRAPILNFEAASATATPTDPTGAVGPSHFLNSWNTSFRIWDKTGTALIPEASLGTVLPGTAGDPIVIYDPFADRFLITEFYSNGFDVAISKGPNPVTSGWYVYRFPTSSFPDYPKFSVWSDGYYITANKDQGSASTSQVVFALERDKMILGNTTAQMIGFPLTGIVTSGFYSPLGFNANGPTMPPVGNAPIVYMQDDSWAGVTTDHLKIWSVNVNWTTPAGSTISSPQILNVAAFDGLFDSGSFSNLPQPSGSDIDALQATIMYMAQYRRFPSYNTVVFNFVVDLDNLDNHAGIRWYELRQTTDGAPWTIYQEGTYAQPGGHSAFSGNMCMDIYGNIGLAYTSVSTTLNPSLRFTGRNASDPLGTMTLAESIIIDGTSIDPSSRYGDYAQMTIDPVDGRTFWSIGEYFSGGRKNRASTFQIAPPTLTAMFTGTPTIVCAGGTVVFTDQSLASPTSWTWSFPGGTPSSFIGQNPPAITYSTAGTYDVTLTVSDGSNTDPEVKTGYITVKNVVANFTGTPTTVVVGNTVTFTDNSSCSPVSWAWSFPGGTPSSYNGQTPPAITYSTVGTYDVSLTVTKPSGSDTKTKTGYITVTPPIFNITNGSITTCTGDFYDTGGSTGVYMDNEVITETFYPSTPGAMLRFNFTSFVTESGYDTLTIYNGINSSAPLIGKYHGSLSPGIVLATNAYGALTFRFRSDVSLTYAGWAAAINCVTGIVADPATFTATPASTSQINLAWSKNVSNNDVMIVWAPTNTFGIPVDGTVYSTGGTVTGGGTVLYRGSLAAFNHTSLSQNTAYFYKAFSYNASNAYSSGFSATASTLCGVASLPFAENFATATLPGCWTKQISGTGAVDKWTVSNTATAGGAAYEMKSTYQNISPAITRLVTPPINTTGVSQLNLSFKHMLDAYGTGCTLRIQSSTNGTTWTNEAWSIASTAANVGPETVSTTVLSNLNAPNTLIAFTIEGNLFQYDYWYVDAVAITYTCGTTYPVSVSIAPSASNICPNTPVTFTATPVNGGTVPAYQWKVNGTNAGTGSTSYSYVPVNNDMVTCILTSNSLCTSGNPATSNSVTMTVNPIVPVGVSIAASANPVCQGTGVEFTATPSNGGTTPAYQWKINETAISGATNATYTYTPANNDVLTCVLTSNASCITGNPATSVPLTMTVNPLLTAGISITPSANPVTAGTSVTFMATTVNGGGTPAYQWMVNGTNTGTNSDTYSYVPADGDLVTCMLTSSWECVSGNPATSNSVLMIVNTVPGTRIVSDITITGTQCFDALQTIEVAGNGTSFIVPNGSYATMVAGQNILFYPGTYVEEGGYLYGYIAPVGPWCMAPSIATATGGTNGPPSAMDQSFYRIYPNPTTGKFMFEINSAENTEKYVVEIYDMKGQKIFSSDLTDVRKHEFSLTGKPAGIYLIRVINEKNPGTVRIIKQN
ncbi:MAG: PKD domain-containing protein [Bacteroidetes bacterium]|nr:PKD domain-containing protein [Bacteroidota bacterium]